MKPKYTEEDVQRALKEVAEGKSIHKAHLDWGVPRSTLQDKIYDHVSQKEAQVPYQRLSTVQEQRLTDWVLTQETLGQSPTHTQIRAFAGRILATKKDAKPLGKR